jgi:hypothetical protein
MSLHQSSSPALPDHMGYQDTSSRFFDGDALEQSTSFCEAREEEEEPLHQGSTHDSRVEVERDDADRYSIQAACTDSSMGSDFGRDETLYIQVIPHATDDPHAKRTFLCRCLAWSQDSLDERVSKKNRRDDSSPTSHTESLRRFSFDQPLHRRQGSTESLHWEEKVEDPLDLINFIQSNEIAHY